MRKLIIVVVFIVVNTLAPLHSFAQSYLYATGAPSFNAQIPIENGFINVNNGEIHIEIPLATQTQRGTLSLNERIVYDSRIWKIFSNNGYSWSPTNVPGSMGGWRFTSGVDTGSATYGLNSQSGGACESGAGTMDTTTYTGFQWTDSSGTQHFFPQKTILYTVHERTCETPPDISVGSGYATDGSGYSMSVTGYTSMTVFDPSGNQIYPIPTDFNGNHFSTDANGNLIDSVGRTPVLTTTSGSEIYYDVLATGGSRSRYTVQTETIDFSTAFAQSAVSEVSGSFTAIKSITLPDGSSYSFGYDSGTSSGSYGEMTSITLPTGGTITYTYQNFLDSFQNQNRWLHTRVKDGGTTTFTPSTINNCSETAGCEEQTIVTTPAGNDTVYTISMDSEATQTTGKSWNTGVTVYQGSSKSGGTKLESVTTTYAYTLGYIAFRGSYNLPASTTSVTTLYDSAVSSQVVTAFDSTGSRPSSVKEWDFYPSSGSPPSTDTRETDYTYTSALPQQITVKDGSGNQVSQTTYTYNETTGTGHAPVKVVTGLPQQPTAGSGLGGNLTTTAQWVNTSGTTLTSEATYDSAGEILTTTTPNGVTTYGYDTTDTFRTSVTAPTPTSGVTLITKQAYDAGTGVLTSSSDENGQTTTYSDFDVFDRAQTVSYPDGGQESFGYEPTRFTFALSPASGVTYYDSYGRATNKLTANGQSEAYRTDTCYNTSGQVSFVSLPYDDAGGANRCSGAGDATLYDALNRPTKVTHADGSSANYTYTGRATKVVDENGVIRISQVDGLGRTTAVCEISSNASMPSSGSPASCGLDVTGTGFLTTYSYSLANHTTSITQGAQSRVFQTDSLGRTVLTKEPEVGSTSYTYAYNSTGLQATRKKPQANQANPNTLTTTTTQYDSIGRVVTVTYTDGTPTKNFYYDAPSGWAEASQQKNLKGRLSWHWRVTGAGPSGGIFSYDAMGRVAVQYSCTPSGCNNSAYDRGVSYTYNSAGMLTSEGDGAGDTYTYSRSPAGEITGITDSFSDSTDPANIIVPGSVQNGPFGATSYALGNGLNAVTSYDSMGRPSGGWVCKGSTQTFCTGGTTQVYGYTAGTTGTHVTNTCDTVLNVCNSFGYDEFSRLTSRTVTSGTVQNFSYTYDRYGNRWAQNAPQGGPAPSISFNPANNIISTAGYANDAAGNVANDGINGYGYDADGNLIAVGSSTKYYYDSLNNRTEIAPTRGTYDFVFDYLGRRVSCWSAATHGLVISSVYSDSGQAIAMRNGGETQFEHQNWLGTERVRTGYNGSVVISIFDLPWGDGHTPSGDNGDQHDFALMDRDLEDGTEHAQFRNYSTLVGRWLSPDPYPGSYDVSDPQSFNRFSYVTNDPVNNVDPTGQFAFCGVSIGADGGLSVAGPIGWAALGTCIGYDIFKLLNLFGGPSFNGSLEPRPTTNGRWNDNFNVPHVGIAAAIGLPDAGCEFGGCGGSSLVGNVGVAYSHVAIPDAIQNFMFAFDWAMSGVHNSVRGWRHGNWCGSGGEGLPIDSLDWKCLYHDFCYSKNQLTFGMNYNFPTPTGEQGTALQQCNQNLCDSAPTPSLDSGQIIMFFSDFVNPRYACH